MTTRKVDEARRAVERAAANGQERRVAPIQVETRADEATGGWTFEGHAAVFDSRSEELGSFVYDGFTEVIKRGAFKDAIRDSDVRFLINHDSNLVLARTRSGTLTLSEDPKGLLAVADVAQTSYGDDLRVLLDRGDVDQMSFAWPYGAISHEEWEEDSDGNVTRTIHKFDELIDVAAVTYPAYPDTDASARRICGVTIFDGDDLDLERVRSVAWKVHRGDLVASESERRAIDALLERHSTVSPWMAERTLVAVASEPELLAAIPDKRGHAELIWTPPASESEQDTEPDGPEVAYALAARQRRLRQRAHLVR